MKKETETLTEKCNRQTQTIAKQQQSIEALQSQDKSMREEFTKVLNSPRREGGDYWGRVSEQRLLSWEEIFFQVGSISARLFNYTTSQDILDLQQRISDLQSKLEPL